MNAVLQPTPAGVVLIVDDTPDNLALLSDALDASGYMVLVAMDGARPGPRWTSPPSAAATS